MTDVRIELSEANLPRIAAETDVEVPTYDRSQITTGIVHVGVGGFFRAHQAMYLDRLMNEGKALDFGIVGVAALPHDRRIFDAMSAQDGLYTLLLKHPDGHKEARVIELFSDKSLVCADCGADFVFTAGEQEFHASKGFTQEPRRCPDCRRARKGGPAGGGAPREGGFRSGPAVERTLYTATCAACGKEAKVPFEPRNGRPVYCRDCFQPQPRGDFGGSRDFGGGSGGFGGGSRGGARSGGNRGGGGGGRRDW